MATAPLAQPATPPKPIPQEIKIYSHSNLFYWWPVWVLGLILALMTLVSGYRLAIVPSDTRVEKTTHNENGKEVVQNKLAAPKGAPLGEEGEPHLHITNKRGFGVLFAVVLLLVIGITNVPLRGMWSVVVIITIIMLTIIFWLAEWLDTILNWFYFMDIRITMGGYVFIAIGLLIMWLLTFFFFDRQIYMVFTPGQVKVCLEIGGGEKAFDTMNISLEKQRSDIFRHWILGLGSGDSIVKKAVGDVHEFHLPNVLFIGKKLKIVEELLRVRQQEKV